MSNPQRIGWINTLQFASKAFIHNSTLPGLNRVHSIAELEEWQRAEGRYE